MTIDWKVYHFAKLWLVGSVMEPDSPDVLPLAEHVQRAVEEFMAMKKEHEMKHITG